MPDLFVDVFALNGKIVCYPDPSLIKNPPAWFLPTNEQRIGCVVLDAGKHVRISREAIDLMKKIKKSHDDIGDIDWWAVTGGEQAGTHAFSWIGPVYRTINPEKAEGSRGWAPDHHLPHIDLNNEEAVQRIMPFVILGTSVLGREPRDIPIDNKIESFFHCGLCINEMPAGTSPQEFAELECGWTALGFQVWCKRHGVNVIHIDFEGAKHPANTARKHVRGK
jgi:hypothetical protein